VRCRAVIVRDIFKPGALSRLLPPILTAFCVTWMVFPLCHSLGLGQGSAVTFLISYLFMLLVYRLKAILEHNKVLFVIVFLSGLVLRYKFSPGFFHWPNLFAYFGVVLAYTAAGILLFQGSQHMKHSETRIPFAPLLFLGCLLSYTPYLSFMMHVLGRR